MAETSPLSKLKDAVVSTYALARGLRGFFREQVRLARAEEELKTAVDRRSETFLEVARTRIYGDAASPYLRLLKLAGCEFSDLRSQVLTDGLEPTLERLARAGVYLTSDEFKGTAEVVRGGLSFRVAPKSFETLRVDPLIESLDEARLLARLRDGLGSGSWGNEFQARVWDGAGTLRIKRVPPVASARGKILPLEVQKKRLF